MRRAKYGVGAAGVLGLAYLLSNFFNWGGPGGTGTTVGVPSGGQVLPTPIEGDPADPAVPRDPADPAAGEPVATTRPIITPRPNATAGPDEQLGAGPTAEVLVDDRDYFLRRGTGDSARWVPADAAAVVAAAKQAPGDGAGVKVRVFRKPSSRATAEEGLTAALHSAGLTDADIEWPERLIE